MASPKKIIDIIPPKRRVAAPAAPPALPQEKKKRPQRRDIEIPVLKILIVLVIIAVIAGAVSLHFVFDKAVIIISPKTNNVSLVQRIVASTNIDEINSAAKQIPGVALSIEKEATQLFSSTGSEENATSAQGIIRVFNERNVVQVLIINTRFVSEDGFVFRSNKKIAIPAASSGVPGYFDVGVTAAQAGPTYNIGPSNFSVPGLAGSTIYTKIYGKSESSMMGGSTGNTKVVAQEDIVRAGDILEETVAVRAKRDLKSQLPQGFVLEDESFVVEVLESDSMVKAGAAIDQFNYYAKVLVKAIAFKSSDMDALALQLIASQVAEDESLNASTFKNSIEVKDINAEKGELGMEVSISASTFVSVATEGFRDLVLDVTPLTAESILMAQEGVGSVQVNLWPFSRTKLPTSKDKIKLQLKVD